MHKPGCARLVLARKTPATAALLECFHTHHGSQRSAASLPMQCNDVRCSLRKAHLSAYHWAMQTRLCSRCPRVSLAVRQTLRPPARSQQKQKRHLQCLLACALRDTQRARSDSGRCSTSDMSILEPGTRCAASLHRFRGMSCSALLTCLARARPANSDVSNRLRSTVSSHLQTQSCYKARELQSCRLKERYRMGR